MIFWIVFIGIVLIGTTIGFFVAKTYWNFDWEYQIGYTAVSVAVGFFAALIVGLIGSANAMSDSKYEVVEEQSLVALATSQETDGSVGFSFFVGYGSVDEKRVAYWTTKDDDGYITMKSEDATNIRIREVSTQPRYVYELKSDNSGFWVPWKSWSTGRYTLEVPVGTTENIYEFQP